MRRSTRTSHGAIVFKPLHNDFSHYAQSSLTLFVDTSANFSFFDSETSQHLHQLNTSGQIDTIRLIFEVATILLILLITSVQKLRYFLHSYATPSSLVKFYDLESVGNGSEKNEDCVITLDCSSVLTKKNKK